MILVISNKYSFWLVLLVNQKNLEVMDMKRKEALKDLVIRLQDSYSGYQDVIQHVKDQKMKEWLGQYAYERKKFQIELNKLIVEMGGQSEMKTSFLGDLHRMFMSFKFSAVNEDMEKLIDEIERGAEYLINDYNTVMNEIDYPDHILTTLKLQRDMVAKELESLLKLKAELHIESLTS